MPRLTKFVDAFDDACGRANDLPLTLLKCIVVLEGVTALAIIFWPRG